MRFCHVRSCFIVYNASIISRKSDSFLFVIRIYQHSYQPNPTLHFPTPAVSSALAVDRNDNNRRNANYCEKLSCVLRRSWSNKFREKKLINLNCWWNNKIVHSLDSLYPSRYWFASSYHSYYLYGFYSPDSKALQLSASLLSIDSRVLILYK